MKVFKFGGASVKDAPAIENLKNILQRYDNEQLVVVISAMGKTTNFLEKVLDAYCRKGCPLWWRSSARSTKRFRNSSWAPTTPSCRTPNGSSPC